MKYIIFTKVLLICVLLINQEKSTVNLSFNLNDEGGTRKEKNGESYEFFMYGQHFESCGEKVEMDERTLSRLNVITVIQFLKEAEAIRSEKTENSATSKTVEIIFNDQIFDDIYLYVRENKEIYRYNVKWIEEITD
jgi:hypothetical protein